MPNIQGGKKYKSRKPQIVGPSFLPPLEDDQMYGFVLKKMGNGRMEVKCYDGKTRVCLICGSMRKRVWIDVSDFVKISCRDFIKYKEDDIEKGDIIMKVSDEQLKLLKKMPECKYFIDACLDLTTREQIVDGGVEFYDGGDAGSVSSDEIDKKPKQKSKFVEATFDENIDIDAI